MDTPNQDGHLDREVVAKLIEYAIQFELAVREGHGFVAAAIAKGILQSLSRFYPTSFSRIADLRPSALQVHPRSSFDSTQQYASMEIISLAIANFKDELMSGNIVRAVEALKPTGLLGFDNGLGTELQELEQKLARTGGVMRLQFLPRVAKLTLWNGYLDRAEAYALEAVKLDPPDDPSSDGQGTHDGHMVLGLISLLRGNIEAAKQHLLESARTNGSGEISLIGPNLSLASELLKRNESEAVLEYFQHCRRFWVEGHELLNTWTERIRRGERVEFDPIYLTL